MSLCRRTLPLALAAAFLVGAAPASTPPSKANPAGKVKLRSVTLAIRHRVFHQFQDKHDAKLNQEFVIGDTEWSARVVRYVPDFAMELKTGKVVSRSPEPRNPAFQIVVRDKGKAVDTTWAMLSMPPHFTRRSFLAFRVMRVDFDGREPMLADSAAVAKELEALKEAARASAPPEREGPPPLMHPPIPQGKEGAMPPGHPKMDAGTIAPVPSHGSGGSSGTGKDAKK
ncbi:MAG TPA: hypothetical protein VFP58_05855 [Candidatus Eisenbacteria bacterium]|nr:hypothetical protein [Candidatus Eisenbacteria bacterium]